MKKDANKNPVAVDRSILDALALDQWNTLSSAEHADIGMRVGEALRIAGWQLDGFVVPEGFGPPGQVRGVLQLRDRATGLRWSVIPGGRFQPGMSERLQPHYKSLYIQMESWKDYAEREEPWQPEPLDRTWTYASGQPCDLRPKPPVVITPFLMATNPASG